MNPGIDLRGNGNNIYVFAHHSLNGVRRAPEMCVLNDDEFVPTILVRKKWWIGWWGWRANWLLGITDWRWLRFARVGPNSS